MRIVHVIEATFAGVGRHVVDLVSAQADSGHDVRVLYSPARESSSFAAERKTISGVDWVATPMRRSPHPTDAAVIARVRHLAVGADVIHGHSTKGGIIARLAARHDQRVIYTPNAIYTMNPGLSLPKRFAVGRFERLLALRTDVIIAVSPEEERHLHSLGFRPSQVHVVLNGIRPYEHADPIEVRTALGLPLGLPIVGFLGRLDAQKDPNELLSIVRLAAETAPSLHLAIVGDGPSRQELHDRVRSDEALASRTSMHGEQPGTWAMAAFDVLVLPSRYEGFPYVLIEAAAQGLAFVASEGCNASRLIDLGAVGDIVDRNDRPRFAQCIADRALQMRRHDNIVVTSAKMASAVENLYLTTPSEEN